MLHGGYLVVHPAMPRVCASSIPVHPHQRHGNPLACPSARMPANLLISISHPFANFFLGIVQPYLADALGMRVATRERSGPRLDPVPEQRQNKEQGMLLRKETKEKKKKKSLETGTNGGRGAR